MRATGIVRRIDDLGRVVIPRELRKNCGIKEGDPLEIFITYEGDILLRKYTFSLDRIIDHLKSQLTDYTDDYEYVSKVNKKLEELKKIVRKHMEE